MVSNCANSVCGKPLHYLREGRIFIFDVSLGASAPGQKRQRCLEHYWLCGTCARALILEQDAQGFVHARFRPVAIQESDDQISPVSPLLAS
jgi:hypothetical protein